MYPNSVYAKARAIAPHAGGVLARPRASALGVMARTACRSTVSVVIRTAGINFSRCRGAVGAPSGSETGQDLVHFVQVLAVQSNRQSLEQGGLLGR